MPLKVPPALTNLPPTSGGWRPSQTWSILTPNTMTMRRITPLLPPPTATCREQCRGLRRAPAFDREATVTHHSRAWCADKRHPAFPCPHLPRRCPCKPEEVNSLRDHAAAILTFRRLESHLPRRGPVRHQVSSVKDPVIFYQNRDTLPLVG